MDYRIHIASSLAYALKKLDEIGIAQKVLFQEGDAAGQLIENKISILDAGSRDGWAIELLASLGYPNAIGVELLEDYVQYAKGRGRNIVQGDLHNLEFGDETFHLVHSRHALEHCLDPIKVLNELLRVTKKKGALFCSFPLFPEPHAKHTLALPNMRIVHKLLKQVEYPWNPIFIGKSSDVGVIPEGNEVIIFLMKR